MQFDHTRSVGSGGGLGLVVGLGTSWVVSSDARACGRARNRYMGTPPQIPRLGRANYSLRIDRYNIIVLSESFGTIDKPLPGNAMSTSTLVAILFSTYRTLT